MRVGVGWLGVGIGVGGVSFQIFFLFLFVFCVFLFLFLFSSSSFFFLFLFRLLSSASLLAPLLLRELIMIAWGRIRCDSLGGAGRIGVTVCLSAVWQKNNDIYYRIYLALRCATMYLPCLHTPLSCPGSGPVTHSQSLVLTTNFQLPDLPLPFPSTENHSPVSRRPLESPLAPRTSHGQRSRSPVRRVVQ
ncbi:hypothetical protein BZA05DRAFT_411081 [Tricharina praecox]|uniref:uncharacterized protein n=1 Tax=Tricharina praecox TaxID=43433 RepID=UPI00221EDCB5|nr:uncharacterized protein BZA05DRAFT_411081 [Tricharina praecox]KAI5843259.1 hypothetical protein BZA05DRAFT_411081 [Tricharina praecox]